MDMMDPHVHVDALNHHALELMALAGVRALISMVAIPEVHENIPSRAIFEHCDRVRSYHAWRTDNFFRMRTFGCVAVSMVGVPIDYEEALARLRIYLREHREEVLGIGEIGLEPSSATCRDMKTQERIFRAQLEIAKEFAKPVIMHTPPSEKRTWVDQYIPILREVGLSPELVIFDHCNESTVKMITDLGYIAAITVQPWRKVRPADAAQLVKDGDKERILIDSDSSLLESDPLAVPKSVLEMRKLGVNEADIRQVVWENPRRIYKLAI